MATKTALTKAVSFDEKGWSGSRSIAYRLPEQWEQTLELRWPMSTAVYDAMRRSDGQLASVVKAIRLPLQAASFRLSEEGVDKRVRDFVEHELGLKERRKRKGQLRIRWPEYASEAFLAPFDGHRVFEQVYDIGPPPDGIKGLPPVMGHLTKLASRPPRTIWGWNIDHKGRLVSVTQLVPDAKGFFSEVDIPVEKLVVHVHDKEGDNWLGNSMLRSSYKHWMLKDMILRIAALAVERNGVGIPVATLPESGQGQAQLEKLVKDYRAGSTAGLVKPYGSGFELLGVQGGLADAMEQVNYHDQAMGRACLAMFLNLGHDNGARSLGDTMVSYFLRAQQALLEDFMAVTTEHVIADLVELNFGPDEPYPELIAEKITDDATPTAEALSTLVNAKLITPDEPLEVYVRRMFGLPDADPKTARQLPADAQLEQQGKQAEAEMKFQQQQHGDQMKRADADAKLKAQQQRTPKLSVDPDEVVAVEERLERILACVR